MPSKKNYKDEKSYQLELTKVRANRREEAERKIGIITVKARGPLPQLERMDYPNACQLSLAMSEAAEVYAQTLRKHLLKRWRETHPNRQVIIIVDHKYVMSKNIMYYIIELSAYGGIMEKDWLKDELRSQGYEIGGYQTRRDSELVVK